MGSTVPAARVALYDALAALTGTGEDLEGVAVIRTGMWDTVSEYERVIVKNARDISRDARLGAQRFGEEYLIPIDIECMTEGADLDEVEARLWELVTIVEQTVLANRTDLAAGVVSAKPGDIPEIESGHADDGVPAARCTLLVEITATASLH